MAFSQLRRWLKKTSKSLFAAPSRAKRPARRSQLGVESLETRLALSLTEVHGIVAGDWASGVVSIQVHFHEDPSNTDYFTTGVMIDSTHVLTCAHGLYRSTSTNNHGFPDTAKVFLGRQGGGDTSFDGSVGVGMYVNVAPHYAGGDSLKNDIAIITVNPQTLPSNFYHFQVDNNTDKRDLRNVQLFSAGYPGETYDARHMYKTGGKIAGVTTIGDSTPLLYWTNHSYNDEQGLSLFIHGQSGSALYTKDAAGNRYVEGIFHGASDDHWTGYATAITTDIHTWINGVLNGSSTGGSGGRGIISGGGGGGTGGGTGGGGSQTVSTSTTLVSSLLNSKSGQSVTFTAMVSAASGSATGTVTFYDGTTVLGTDTLTPGEAGTVAYVSTPNLPIGTHSITATYSGDSGHTGSNSAALTETVWAQIDVTYTTLYASTLTPNLGDAVTFTATVDSPQMATGTVSFYDGDAYLGTATLQRGNGDLSGMQATLTTTSLGVGSHSISAQYSGDATESPSRTSWSLVIAVAPMPTAATVVTTTSLRSSLAKAVVGQSVTFTATVAAGDQSLTGSVTFFDGNATLGVSKIVVTQGAAEATFTTSALTAGAHAITAQYSDDTGLAMSNSTVLTETIAKAAPPPPVAGNHAPILEPIAAQKVLEGAALVFQAVAHDADADQTLTFTLDAGAPAGAGIDPATGQFTWTPSVMHGQLPGAYSVTVRATDNGVPALSSSQTVTITVQGVADPGRGKNAWELVANALTHSAEFYTNFINGAYNRYLGRTPDAAGLAYWVDRMQHGLSDERLEAGFIGSDEYIHNHGGTGANWVRGLYIDLLGRMPNDAEVASWVSNLTNGTKAADVAFGFAASAEREGQRVGNDYRSYLGRDAHADETAYWVGAFLTGADNEKVVAGFVSSPEFFESHGNNVNDWLFVNYRDLLHRTPDQAGFDRGIQTLKGG